MRIEPRVGTRIGEYEIQQVIGRGGRSVVYLGQHIRLKRKVALKLLSPELAEDRALRDRYTIEWERLAQLDHPNIIPIFDADEVEGVPYIAMKHVSGESLADAIEREGALDPRWVLDILDQVAAALEFAHKRGVFHRDLKPHNILITSDADPAGSGQVYLCDFAIIDDTAASRGLTSPAQTVGTRDYMAPEQFRGDPVDGRTDVYSLGCVLFETLTGSPPFASEEADRLMYAHFEKPPPSAHERRSDLPIAIDAVLEKALAKRKEDRFQRPTDLLASARESLTGRPLELPRAAAFVAPDDLAATSSPNVALTLPIPTELNGLPSAPTRTAPTAPAPVDASGAVLTLPTAPIDDWNASLGAIPDLEPPGDARPRRRRLLLVSALVVGLALVGGIAFALTGGQDEDVRAVVPSATGPAATGPAETGPTGSTGVVEPSNPPVEAPRNVEVAFAGAELVRIEWQVPNAGAPPIRFLVFRDDESVGSVTRPLYRDTDVAPGERHVYWIVSVGEDGSTAQSAQVIANVPVAQEPAEQPSTGGGEAPPPPPPDQCDGLVVGDDCLG